MKNILFLCHIVDRIIQTYHERIIPKKTLEDFLDMIRPSLVVWDWQHPTRQGPYKNMKEYLTASILGYCEENDIPTMMMPHGGSNLLTPLESYYPGTDKLSPETHYYPDVLTLGLECEREVKKRFIGPNTKVEVLGQIRYEKKWIDKINEIAKVVDFKVTKINFHPTRSDYKTVTIIGRHNG